VSGQAGGIWRRPTGLEGSGPAPPKPTRADPVPGDVVAGYEIVKLLGEGGAGVVYRVRDRDGRALALKLGRQPVGAGSTAARRLERELSGLRRVTHSAVVRPLEAGTHEDLPFMVLPLLEGGSLQGRIDESGALGLVELARVVGEAGAILESVHAAGLVHRDLKPANLLLDAGGTVHLTDFGLVKDLQRSALTGARALLGTLAYMAPEQIRGQSVSSATDVYALGCVAYCCATGGSPFGDRGSVIELSFAHLHDPPRDPCDLRRELPAGAGAAILSALAKEPDDRPSGAGQFAAGVVAAIGAAP
jgi:serine/threonine protein kinase